MPGSTGPDLNTYTIPEVQLGDTFNVWRDASNTAIYKLNKLKVYDANIDPNAASIGATYTTAGVWNAFLQPTVTSGHTFSNLIRFTSGISANGGFTFGGTVLVVGGVSMSDALTVGYTTTLNGNVVLGKISTDTITANGVFVNGLTASGAIRANAGATASTLDVTGAARIAGGLSASALYASAGSTFASNLHVGGGFTANGNAVLNGQLKVAGAAVLSSTLNVSAATQLDTTLNVIGASTLAGTTASTLDVTGAARFAGYVGIGTTAPSQKLSIKDGTIRVDNGSVVGLQTLILAGNGSNFQIGHTSGNICSILNSGGGFEFSGNVTAPTPLLAVVGGLSASALYASAGSTFASNLHVGGGFTAMGAATLNNTLNVGAATQLGTTLLVAGVSTLAGTTASTLNVTGAARFNGGATASTLNVSGGVLRVSAVDAEVRISSTGPGGASAADWGILPLTSTTPLFRIYDRYNNLNRLTIDGSGLVSIPNGLSASALDVLGNISATNRLIIAPKAVTNQAQFITNVSATIAGTNYTNGGFNSLLALYGTDGLAVGSGAGIMFGGAFDSTDLNKMTTWAEVSGVRELATTGNYDGALVFKTRANSISAGLPTEKMRVTSTGLVGIGASNPLAPLHVKGTAAEQLRLDSSNSNVSLGFFSGSTYKGQILSSGDSTLYLSSAGNTVLQTGATTSIAIISATQRVGIGNTNPQATLDVTGAIRASTTLDVGATLNAQSSFVLAAGELYTTQRTFTHVFYAAGSGTASATVAGDSWTLGTFTDPNSIPGNFRFVHNSHTGNNLSSDSYEWGRHYAVDAPGGVGAFSNWVELPVSSSVYYGVTRNFRFDVRKQAQGPMELRMRCVLTGILLGSHHFTFTTTGNTIYTPTVSYPNSAAATPGTADPGGFHGKQAYEFPVSNGSYGFTPSKKGLFITNAGRVGIGTSVPSYDLVVAASNGNGIEFGAEYAAGNNLLQCYNRTSAVYTKLTSVALSHAIYSGSVPTEKVTIDSSGNVGIGTTAPTVKLQVNGSIRPVGGTDLPAQVSGNAILVGGVASPDSGRIIIGDGSGWKYTISNRMSSATTDLVTFVDNGMVGIGVSSPTVTLDIAGGIKASTWANGQVSPGAYIQAFAPTSAIGFAVGTVWYVV